MAEEFNSSGGGLDSAAATVKFLRRNCKAL